MVDEGGVCFELLSGCLDSGLWWYWQKYSKMLS